jgi:hypothetical protein
VWNKGTLESLFECDTQYIYIYSLHVHTHICFAGRFKRYLTLTAAQMVMYHCLQLRKPVSKTCKWNNKNITSSYNASSHRKYFLVALRMSCRIRSLNPICKKRGGGGEVDPFVWFSYIITH